MRETILPGIALRVMNEAKTHNSAIVENLVDNIGKPNMFNHLVEQQTC
jgi:hypothetical protein